MSVNLSSSLAGSYVQQAAQRSFIEAQKKREDREAQSAQDQLALQEKTSAKNSTSSNQDSLLQKSEQADSVRGVTSAPATSPQTSDTKLQAKKAKLERLEARLEQAEQQELRDLKARDREVKQHEIAHSVAGGAISGAPSYQFVTGPDGARYAVSGEVSVRLTESSDPKKTLENMQQVQRAALAPAEPSAQDRKVASQAARIAMAARAEIMKQAISENQESKGLASETSEKPNSESTSSEAVKEARQQAAALDKEKKEAKNKSAEDKEKKSNRPDFAALYQQRREEIYQFLQNTIKKNASENPASILREQA